MTTTTVPNLTLDGYTPIEGGYVTNGMTLEADFSALDTAVKNAVAGGGEVNQNAWSNITIPVQSTSTSAVPGQAEEITLAANAKTDTFIIDSGNKWIDVKGEDKRALLMVMPCLQMSLCPSPMSDWAMWITSNSTVHPIRPLIPLPA